MRVICAPLILLAPALGIEQLPSFRAATSESKVDVTALNQAKWWAHVGEHVYTAPSTDSEVLSQNIGDYYAGLGSESALSDSMRERRVGGHGRWHIFHVPEGPSALKVNHRGDRRSGFSKLIQLRSGDVMPATFPVYEPSGPCANPLAEGAQRQERSAVASITAESYMAILKDIVNIKDNMGFQTRSWLSKSAQENAQAYLTQQFTSMGLPTCLQKFAYGGTPQANVVAVIPGTTADTLTVGAHYDSRPFSQAAPGAEDNGSGLAALISVAKAYTALKIKPKKTIYFVAFAGEEEGLLGSDFFAKELKDGSNLPAECGEHSTSFLQVDRRAEKKKASHEAIAMDEVGWVSPSYSRQTVNLESYDWTPNILNHLVCSSKVHNGDDLEVVHSNNPFGSDHMSFLERGMRAVLVINGDDEAYPNYHMSSDTIGNVNGAYAAKNSKMVLGAVMRLAEGGSD